MQLSTLNNAISAWGNLNGIVFMGTGIIIFHF
jgi:hypothetical protein